MSLDDGSWSGKATCEVRLADGTTVPLGTFWLDKGYGAWTVALPAGTGHIQTRVRRDRRRCAGECPPFSGARGLGQRGERPGRNCLGTRIQRPLSRGGR